MRPRIETSAAMVQTRKTGVITGRAAVLSKPGEISIVNVEYRTPYPREVRVRLEGCGVCGSNIPVWEGQEWFNYPLEAGEPGHEGWGRIESVGEDVTELHIEDRVAFLSTHAFAEYDFAMADEVVQVPPSLDHQLFPGEAIGCAMNIFRRCDIEPRQTVAIVGIGFLGALLTQLAVKAGAYVIAISRRDFALRLAKQFGAQQAVEWNESQAVTEKIKRSTNAAGCECVIEVVGKQSSLDLATQLTRERGKLVIAGYHQDGPRTVDMQTWNWRGLDVVNAHERAPSIYVRGIRDAIDAVESGEIDLGPLITHQFPLEQLGEALQAVSQRPDGFLKAVIRL